MPSSLRVLKAEIPNPCLQRSARPSHLLSPHNDNVAPVAVRRNAACGGRHCGTPAAAPHAVALMALKKRRASGAPLQTRKRVGARPSKSGAQARRCKRASACGHGLTCHWAGESTSLLESPLLEGFVSFLVSLPSMWFPKHGKTPTVLGTSLWRIELHWELVREQHVSYSTLSWY